MMHDIQILLFVALVPLAFAQSAANNSLAINYNTGSCPSGQYFDSSTLSCIVCPQGYVVSDDKLGCKQCDTSSGFFYDTLDGFGTAMTWAASPSVATCSCPRTVTGATISATVFVNGTYRQRCVVCPSGYSAGTNALGQPSCLPPPSSGSTAALSPQLMFNAAVSKLNGVNPSYASAVTASFPSSAAGPTSNISPSYPLANLLGPSALNCLGTNRVYDMAACNAVANLCVLQLYSKSTTACQIYSSLVSTLASTAPPVNPARPNTDPLPWLYYNSSSSYATATDLNIQFAMRGAGAIDPSQPNSAVQTVSVVTLVLSAYALNGTWLGYQNWTKEFQICGTDKKQASNWVNFGWLYANSCSIDLSDVLLELNGGDNIDTVLYDVYLQNGGSSLYPIPITITNYPDTSVRRFFYVDGAMGTMANGDGSRGELEAVQYPTSMSLTFTLLSSPRNQIYPPSLVITYAARTLGVSPQVADPASFTVTYQNNAQLNTAFWYAWQVTLIVVLAILAFPVFVMKSIGLYRKRRGAEGADSDFFFSLLIAFIDIGSAGITLALIIVTLYYLVLYKLQNSVFYLMVPNGSLFNLTIAMILAIVGQVVGMAHMLYIQTKHDVFFVDWEKPRKVLAKEGGKEEPSPISCWRMLLLANEWSELQTQRITYPGFTLLLMGMILIGQNLIVNEDVTPLTAAAGYTTYSNNVASVILRFGIEVAFFLVLGVGQWIWRWITNRFVGNPVSNFIDLAFLSNISLFIFDERHCGYYIHGRNRAQHSDTGLVGLNQELLKEEEGLVGNRGLVTTYHDPKMLRLNDNQIFSIFITSGFRETLEVKLLRLVMQALQDAQMRKGSLTTFLKGSGKGPDANHKGQQELSNLFKQMVEDVERNHATRVVDPTYFQMVTRFPPLASNNEAVFIHDYFNSFTSTMFIGNELRLYTFEALFFCVLDSTLQNVTLTAFITYILWIFIKWIRRRMGENNLSRKTLVDQHFLM